MNNRQVLEVATSQPRHRNIWREALSGVELIAPGRRLRLASLEA